MSDYPQVITTAMMTTCNHCGAVPFQPCHSLISGSPQGWTHAERNR